MEATHPDINAECVILNKTTVLNGYLIRTEAERMSSVIRYGDYNNIICNQVSRQKNERNQQKMEKSDG